MSKLRILSMALAASVCLAAASHAAPVSLNLKYGLWEVTSAGTTSGAPPIPASTLANLTPAQKAKMQAAIAAAMASSGKPHTYKSCITAESIQRGFKDPELSNGCTETVVSSTQSDMQVKLACTGRQQMTGTLHFQTSSPVAMSGTIDVTVTENGGSMKVNRQISGQWVSADCGDVKP